MHWLWYTLPLVSSHTVRRVLEGKTFRTVSLPEGRERGRSLVGATRRVLAVAAHPDDLEYFCGGTLALLAESGCRVTACLATRGERGGRAPDLPHRRTEEQERAAAILGYSAVRQWDYPDGGLQRAVDALTADLRHLIVSEDPDLLLTFDPVHPYLLYRHPDHMTVSRATLAVATSVPEIALFHSARPDTAVEITPVVQKKADAFLAHASQLPGRHAARLLAYHLRARFGDERDGALRYYELFRWRRRCDSPPQ